MTRAILGCAVLALAAGSAQAAYFSFASDNNHTDWTFGGFGASVNDAQDPSDPMQLLIDDDNGLLPQLAFNVEFEADFDIAFVGSVPLGGNLVHTYSVNGTFSFLQAGNPLLTGTITNGALSAIGTQGAWFSTAAIQGNDNPNGSVSYQWFGADNPAYGLFASTSIGPDDGAFTLTVLNDGTPGVGLDPANLPSNEWFSEGSFSGSAQFIPTPGSLAVLGLAALAGLRRRR